MDRKLRMGMVGGGKDAFIGAVHRIAAFIDGKIELVCGAFSVDPETSQLSGKELFVNPDRVYGSFEEMIEKEAELPESERMDFLTIVTPNFLHFAPAKLALLKGFDVVVEKPMTLTLEEALEFIADDELVEVTPTDIRLRKKILDPKNRFRDNR